MIRTEIVAEGIWHIELCRPEKRNALGEAMYLLLADTLAEIKAAPDARVVIVSGQGEAFCAGNDIAEFETRWPQPPHGPVVRFLKALHGFDRPIVAAVQGPAIGIGATLLLHCDLVVASPEAYLQFPFLDRGITVEGGGSYLLPLRLGYLKAIEILLTGRRVYADEAKELGLVTTVSGKGSAFADALSYAHEIAQKSPAAVVATKQLLRKNLSAALVPLFEEEIQQINELIEVHRKQ